MASLIIFIKYYIISYDLNISKLKFIKQKTQTETETETETATNEIFQPKKKKRLCSQISLEFVVLKLNIIDRHWFNNKL